MRVTSFLATTLLVGTLVACGSAPGHGGLIREQDVPRALSEHGVAIGQRVPEVLVSCADGSQRQVGRRDGLQLVLFATASDCALCNLHLESLAHVDWTQVAGLDRFVVAWTPSSRDLRQLESQEVLRNLPLQVCADSSGILWDSLGLAHTPFTAILREDRIVYVYDGDVARGVRGDQFLKDVADLIHGAASDTVSRR